MTKVQKILLLILALYVTISTIALFYLVRSNMQITETLDQWELK